MEFLKVDEGKKEIFLEFFLIQDEIVIKLLVEIFCVFVVSEVDVVLEEGVDVQMEFIQLSKEESKEILDIFIIFFDVIELLFEVVLVELVEVQSEEEEIEVRGEYDKLFFRLDIFQIIDLGILGVREEFVEICLGEYKGVIEFVVIIEDDFIIVV